MIYQKIPLPIDYAAIGTDGQSWAMVALDADGQALCPSPV